MKTHQRPTFTPRSLIQTLTTALTLVVVLSLGLSAVSIAYAVGRHSHAPTQTDGWRGPGGASARPDDGDRGRALPGGASHGWS